MPDDNDVFLEEIRQAAAEAEQGEGVSLVDFYAYMPMHNYIFTPCRAFWPADSVNARLPWIPTGELDASGKEKFMLPSVWLDRNRPVELMTWAPGEPLLIRDSLIAEGGWFARKGVCCLNLYRPPTLVLGNPDGAERWINHVYNIYPDEAAYIIQYLAHRVQRPWEKINHALVLGGNQGIGKDTILEPVRSSRLPVILRRR
jgi:hypothetical protein